MPDTNTKVLFHPLERLDLVDLNGVQDLAHSALSEYIGAVTTAKSGVVNSWSSVTFDTVNHRISFTDFTALGRTSDKDGNQSYAPSYLLKFNASDAANGDCSYDSARAAVQSYFNSNGSLPPAPTDAAFNSGLHNEFYPFIYCRPVVNNGSSQVRRFWSLADAQETTDTVATRSKASVEFTLVSPSLTPSAGGDYSWIHIGQVASWTESGGTVEISSIREYHIADSLLLLEDNQTVREVNASAAFQDGLDRAVVFLQDRIQDLLDNGTQDSASATDFSNYARPRLSLSGLDYEFSNRVTKIEQHTLTGSYIVNSVIDAGAGTDNVTVTSNAALDPFVVNGFRDYAMLNTTYRGGGAVSFPIAVADYTGQVQKLARAAYSVFISIPPAYTGWYYTLNATPIAFIDYQNHMNGLSLAVGNTQTLLTTQWHILKDEATASIDELQTISAAHNALDSTGTPYNTTGIRLVGSPAFIGESLGTEHLDSVATPVPLSIFFKLDITLINPNSYGGL